MRKSLLFGALVFVVVVISQAPATLLRSMVERSGQATLLAPNGTLWQGSGDLLIAGTAVGRVFWDLQGVTILQGKLSYHVTLESPEQNLTGTLLLFPATGIEAISGSIEAAAVNRWLAPYNINLSGSFDLENVSLLFASGRPHSADGEVHWQGGAVDYRLANENSTGILPAMTAILGPSAEAAVFEQGGQTPLLKAELQANGFARIGVTKLLTKILNRPWPGSDADHEVVLEVEEQVF